MAEPAFQSDAFQGDAFQSINDASFSVTEGGDVASFNAGIVASVSFAVNENGPDTAAFTVNLSRLVEFDITEGADVASFTSNALTTAEFSILEEADTPSIEVELDESAYVEFRLTEGADTASFQSAIVGTVTINITEGADTAAFTTTAVTHANFDIVEGADVASFRSFVFTFEDTDAFVIVVPYELQAIQVPPAMEESPYDWNVIEVAQTKATRRKD